MDQIVTIDGPAGSGKSTVSRRLARRIGYSYLDTGGMYRAVALFAKRSDMDLQDGEALGDMCRNLDIRFDRGEDPPRLRLGEEDISDLIRSPEMDMLSSRVSAVREVREAMAALQRRMARAGGMVAEGRDMGTVIFPDARWKFYLTASMEARAERRYRERQERGETVREREVLEDLKRRDDQDRMREFSPLKPADDAVIIDSTLITVDEVVEQMFRRIRPSSDPEPRTL